MKLRRCKSVLVAGGAGFIGSHLCEALLDDGVRVTCLDSLLTGRLDNLAALTREPRFEFIEADVIDLLPPLSVDAVLNLACPASPPRYQADPVHTLMTSVVGTRNLLSLAQANRARLLMASTSEVYGDPDVHPQPESYCGNVNPTGPRACYDEGKRAAETLCFDQLRRGLVDVRVALQHLLAADVTRRWPGGFQRGDPGAVGRSHHDLRRRTADAILLLCG